MLEHFFLVLIEVKTIQDTSIALDQFSRGESFRDTGGFGMVFDQDHDTVEASMDRTATIVLVAEVHASR